MSKIAEGYKQTEVGVIPRDWEVKKLSDISNMKSGDSITSKRIFEIDSYPCYGGNGLRGYTSKYTHDGDYALIGRQGALCGNVQFVMDKFFASEHAVVVTPKTNTDIKWLYYMLIDMNLNQYSESSAQPGLSVSKILNLPIHLPPTKAEQTAIATVLNDADALITQLEKLIAKKRNIKQGAMQELLRPKKGWEVKKLGDVFRFLNTANNARADLLESGEVEYIHYGDIHTRWNCFLDCSKNELPFIDKGKITGVPLLENGDLVIADASEDYEGLGACIEINNIGKRKIIAGLHTLLLRGNKNILADGFKGNLRNYKGVKDALIRVSTGVSVFGISKTNLKEIEISIPSIIEEQKEIAQILSDMDAEIEALEKKLEKYKMIKQGMMQNLLTGRVRLI